MPEWVPINWTLVSNWKNWVIILLMLIIASIAFDLLATLAMPEHAPAMTSLNKGQA